MTKNNPTLSIVVPFYNEEKNIPLVLKSYKNIKTNISYELLLVNNGSTDNSKNVFKKLLNTGAYPFAHLITVKKNIGYGFGIVSGIKKANGDVISWTHADMQTDAKDVFHAYKIYQQLKNSKVVVKGRRTNRSFSSVLFSFGMAIIASILLGRVFFEINAQPKLFHRSLLKYFKNPPNDFSLDLYFLMICKKYNYKVVTIPVAFPNRRYGTSRWSYSFSSRLKTTIRSIKYIATLRKLIDKI